MDPVSTAIITALSAGVSDAIPDVAKKVLADGYDGFKALLKKKFGSGSDVTGAVGKAGGRARFRRTPECGRGGTIFRCSGRG